MKLVHFGAGNIGRSLVGTLFSAAGWEIVFVDTVERVVDELNSQRGYLVLLKGELPAGDADALRVDNVRGVLASDTARVIAELADCDLISTAVGAGALRYVLPVIAQAVTKREQPVSIMFCENLHGAAEYSRRILLENLPADYSFAERIGLVETSIGKMVPIMPAEVGARDPLEVWGEPYNRIIADRDGFVGKTIDVAGVELRENFSAYVDRKLYIHNLSHAAAAWHGFMHGFDYIWQTLEDPWIYNEVAGVMRESAAALESIYGKVYLDEPLAEYCEDLLERFANKALGDTVYRVGRDLQRKLAFNDRAIGALRNCADRRLECEHIYRAVAAALCFEAAPPANSPPLAGDIEVSSSLEVSGVEQVLLTYAGLDAEANKELIANIASRFYAVCPDKYLAGRKKHG